MTKEREREQAQHMQNTQSKLHYGTIKLKKKKKKKETKGKRPARQKKFGEKQNHVWVEDMEAFEKFSLGSGQRGSQLAAGLDGN